MVVPGVSQQQRRLVGRGGAFQLKGQVAGEAVLLLERAEVAKLREADGNPPSDGSWGLEDRALGDEEELFTVLRGGPGGDVRPVEVDGGGRFLFFFLKRGEG